MLKESLFKEKKLNISIDSESFQELLFTNNRNAENILKHIIYFNDDYFEIIRSPLETESHELLKKLPYFTIKENKNSFLHYDLHDVSSLYTHNPYNIPEHPNNNLSYTQIGLTEKLVLEKGKEIFGKVDLDENEKKSVFLMIIQPFLMSNAKIFITENKIILKNKEKFYQITDNPPIIVNLKLAKEIIGLYMRYKNIYDINIHSEGNNLNFPIEKIEFYEYSLLSKIPYLPFNIDNFEDLKKSLINRFLYLLMSLDEIGIQYYNGTDNNSMFNSLYHFNYLISLITGIFDNLAHITKNEYNIITENNSDITINPKSSKIILKSMEQNNNSLYEHLIFYSNFIILVHDLRNKIIHNEMLENGAFHTTAFIVTKGVKFQKELLEKLKMCSYDLDKSKRHEYCGILTVDKYSNGYVDLFKFAKASCMELFRFTNTYMELIGQDNFINVLKKENPRYSDLFGIFEENKFDLNLDETNLV